MTAWVESSSWRPFHLCDTAAVNDWANPGESRFFYTLAGSDKQCGGSDDVEKSTRLTAPASEAPVTVPGKRLAAIQTPGATAQDGTNAYMIAYDASFAPSLYRLPLSATHADSAVQMTWEAGRTVTSLLFQTNNKADAEWLGFTDVGSTSTAVLATGLSATGKYGGATVSTLVVATGASGITLGSLPAEIDTVERARWSGPKGLLRGFTLASGGATYGEILFADAGTAGSLVRVTNTAAVSESLP
jgi:hypothetical protein